MAKKIPIDQGLIARAITGVKYVITGKGSEWFGPGQPVTPLAQDADGVVGRAFDFPIAFNTLRSARETEGGVTNAQLRNFADGYDLLRLVIETRKDQMSKMNWSFGMKDKKAQPDKRVDELNAFFMYPDQEHDWDTWLRALLEDQLVIDAATIYPRKTLGGDMYAFELVDGATIKRLIDASGRTPLPPEPAYQQVLKGIVGANYSRDDLIYRPRNVRTNKIYGYSPVEQVIMTVNIAIRRQLHQLQYYTEGNVPEALIGVPPEWNPDQIKQFQDYWDSILEGDTAARRHAKFVPGGMTPTFTKDAALKDGYDEWLARIICFAFNISPQALVAQMNRATAETAQTQALQEGLLPMMNWVKNLLDYIVAKYFGYTDIEFRWDEDDDTSPETQQKILSGYVQSKIMTDDEARAKLGLDPLSDEQRERLTPPPPPQLMPGAPGDGGEGDPNKPKEPGAEEQPAKKFESSGLRKASSTIDRDRKSVKKAVANIKSLVAEALADDAKAVKKEISGEIDKAAGDSKSKATKIADSITLKALREIEPDIAANMEIIFGEGTVLGLKQVLSEITESQFEQANSYAITWAKERAAELITGMEDSTRDMIRDNIATALEEGWGASEIEEALMDSYAFSEERAETVARTEMAFADVQGNLEAYRSSGVVEGKQWITAAEGECDDCQALHEEIVGLDEEFSGGVDAAPLHPNCRCDVQPVLKED